jgi:MoaA/NifB/PqqE/SkfB family radical SAM enzyme
MIIVWRVSERCNLSCKFCGFDRELQRPRAEADPGSILRLAPILSEYQRVTGDAVLVSWLGGEPLLWKPLTALTQRFARDHRLRVSTTTNGTTLGSPGVRAHLLEYYSELTISVDGVGGVHDRSRGWAGGYGALRRDVTALANEKRNGQAGPLLRANVLLMRQTISGFAQLCFELSEWGFEEVTFNQLGGNDRPEFYPAHRLLPEQADRFTEELPGLRAALARRGLRLGGGEPYLRRIRASSRDERLPVDDCKPGQQFLFINETGLVAPCSFSAFGYGVSVDEIGSVEALCGLPAWFAEGRQRRRLPACEDCHSTRIFEKFAA